MKLTTKGRYAVTAMLDLSMRANTEVVALADIAVRQGISLAYLEQLFAKLRRVGLVTSVRGPGGGYRLARPADAISIADVIAAIDENIDTTRCGGKKNCQGDDACLTHELWEELGANILEFLRSMTLADMAGRPPVKARYARQEQRSALQQGRGRGAVTTLIRIE